MWNWNDKNNSVLTQKEYFFKKDGRQFKLCMYKAYESPLFDNIKINRLLDDDPVFMAISVGPHGTLIVCVSFPNTKWWTEFNTQLCKLDECLSVHRWWYEEREPTRCHITILLNLWFAQHVSGTIMRPSWGMLLSSNIPQPGHITYSLAPDEQPAITKVMCYMLWTSV